MNEKNENPNERVIDGVRYYRWSMGKGVPDRWMPFDEFVWDEAEAADQVRDKELDVSDYESLDELDAAVAAASQALFEAIPAAVDQADSDAEEVLDD
jgi:hypothetical protein